MHSQSPVSRILASRLYLGATVAMFLSGLGTSATAPQIVLFLVRELDAPLAAAGLFYLTSLAAPFAGYLIGSRSDKTGDRLGLFRLCALAGFIGWAAMAMSSALWMPFVISTFILAFSGAAASQVFAALHDDLARNPSDTNENIVAIVRMALTAGWVIGPVLGAWFAATLGLRLTLWLTAFVFLAQILPLGRLSVRAEPASKNAKSKQAKLTEMLPLLTFTGLFVLVYAGEPIKYGFLLVYMEETLGLDPFVRGAVIGIQPLVELAIMPFGIVLSKRFGMLNLMAMAAGTAAVANLCFATWPTATGMFVGQILMGGVWAVFMVLGIIIAQRLLPSAIATASAIYMNAPALASAIGGLAGGTGVSVLGLPEVFFLPAILSTLAAIGLWAMSRQDGERR